MKNHQRRSQVSELIPDQRFLHFFEALERRHMSDLTFQEVRRGVQALSATYVENRRTRLESALGGAGKRAAFAMFYAPLHFLLIREVVRKLGAGARRVTELLDLGCGTGAAGAAWALETASRPRVTGVERNGWAASEARWSWHQLGIDGTVRKGDIVHARLPTRGSGIILGFTANELDPNLRAQLKKRLLASAERGASVCIVEPVARRLLPWWDEWTDTFEAAGGTVREWRFRAKLPPNLELLDKAAGLDHRLLTGRSLWLPGE